MEYVWWKGLFYFYVMLLDMRVMGFMKFMISWDNFSVEVICLRISKVFLLNFKFGVFCGDVCKEIVGI